jgi:hypothetical protein
MAATSPGKIAALFLIAASAIAAITLLSWPRQPKPRVEPNEVDRATPPGLVRFVERAEIVTGLNQPRAIAADGFGVIVAGDRVVVALDLEGRVRWMVGLDGDPSCVAVGPDGRVYVGVGDHVEVIHQGRRRPAWPKLEGQPILTSIAAGASQVFVADFGRRAVWRLDLDGKVLGLIDGRQGPEGRGFEIPSPYFDVALAQDGMLWIANTGRWRLESYDAECRFVRSWGKQSEQIDGFCGCCNPSHIAVRPDGSFVTSEKGIERVKVYDAKGGFYCVVAGAEAFSAGVKGMDLAVDGAGRVLVLDPSRKTIRVFEEQP